MITLIWMIVIVMLVKYRRAVFDLIPRKRKYPPLDYDPLEPFGGLDYRPTKDQPKGLRRVK